MEKIIEVKSLSKEFDGKEIFKNISFYVKKGEFLSILGPSGCGKTTLLRILIGLEMPSKGLVYKNKKDITTIHPSKRGMGIVFQNFALFPNMSVLENVSYALNIKTKNKEQSKKTALNVIKKVGLLDQINKKPNELSGGQQQRVAIARTLVLNPDIILFDEPMSALDEDNRLKIRKELKDIQNKFKITMLYVTHDQEEACSLSDRIMVMNNGKIEQIDTPNKIFNEPATTFVRSFVRDHLIEKVSSIERCTKVDL